MPLVGIRVIQTVKRPTSKLLRSFASLEVLEVSEAPKAGLTKSVWA